MIAYLILALHYIVSIVYHFAGTVLKQNSNGVDAVGVCGEHQHRALILYKI
jgi:hypothetical protein